MSKLKLEPYSIIYRGDHINTMDTTVRDCMEYILEHDTDWKLTIIERMSPTIRDFYSENGDLIPAEFYGCLVRGFHCERVMNDIKKAHYTISI